MASARPELHCLLSIAVTLAEVGLEITLVQANKDRLNGWQRMKSWLKPVRKLPERPPSM